MRRFFLLLSCLLLAACALQPVVRQPALRVGAEPAAFVLNARIAVKHDGKRSSAALRWTHQDGVDEMLLFGPFGQTLASIRRDAHEVVLETSQQRYSAQDAAELTHQVLGWSLPLDGLQYWVLAMPTPQGAADMERDAQGQLSMLRQDGWEIRYTRYATPAVDSLPQRMLLQRAGLEIQLLVDTWEIH